MAEANTPKVVRFRIGQAVKVGQRYGRVYGIFKYFIVVDFKKYKECFPYRKNIIKNKRRGINDINTYLRELCRRRTVRNV